MWTKEKYGKKFVNLELNYFTDFTWVAYKKGIYYINLELNQIWNQWQINSRWLIGNTNIQLT